MMRETYKGRKLIVKKGREWGTVISTVNGHTIGISATRDEAREMESSRRWVDFADEKRITDPTAFDPAWYVGATS